MANDTEEDQNVPDRIRLEVVLEIVLSCSYGLSSFKALCENNEFRPKPVILLTFKGKI